MKNLEKIDSDMLIWVRELLWQGVVTLTDIPRSFRQSHSSVYVNAFRSSNGKGTYKRFIADLNVLCDDIMLLEIDNNAEYSNTLIKLLDTTLEINSFVGDENFEHYKDNLDESLLRKLQEFRRNNSEELAAQIRKYYAKK